VKTTKVLYECPECDHSFAVTYHPGIPAKIHPVDDSHPAEPAEVDPDTCPQCGAENDLEKVEEIANDYYENEMESRAEARAEWLREKRWRDSIDPQN
jgi:hypothetical protein